MHVKKNFLRYLIRKVTKSYWDHVALVLFSKDVAKGQYYNQIIEAVAPRGIEVHKLDKYLKDPEKYEIGIKRVPDLDPETRKRILSFMLMNVDIPYDYLRLLGFLLKFVELKLKGGNKHVKDFLINKDTFVCSSFIQKAFYNAVAKEQKQAVVFKDGIDKRDLPLALEEVTAADIARSKNCEWIYNPHN